MMKYCKSCKKEKPLSEFGKHKNMPDGLRWMCKECTRRKNQELRKRGKAEENANCIDKEWVANNLDSVSTCGNCGGLFQTRRGMALKTKFCSKECSYESNYVNADELEKKAVVIGANLLMGKGKKEYLTKLISNAIGSECPYCGVELTIKNLSLDHKEAYQGTNVRRNKAENKEIRAHMDRKENLHIVCKDCNQLKGAFDHDDFVDLLRFIGDRPRMEEVMRKRLVMSYVSFGARR